MSAVFREALGARSRLFGILNVTPDSFSDGGQFADTAEAARRALAMLDEGAWAIDVGGESTRPGFEAVSAEVEARRVVPVVEAILEERANAMVSVDTSKAAVARAALKAGARIVNDVRGLLGDPELAGVVVEAGASVILMSNLREGGERVGGAIEAICAAWERSLEVAARAGIGEDRIALDPGIGFGTTRAEDLEILRRLPELCARGFPVMLGASRKRVTAGPLGLPVGLRLETTIATTAAGVAAGVAFFRVHDVAENARFVSLLDMIHRGGRADE